MPDDPVPHFQPMNMSCKCGHRWTGHLPVEVEVSIFTAAIRAIRCPKCGMGPKGTYLGDRYPTTTKDEPRSSGRG